MTISWDIFQYVAVLIHEDDPSVLSGGESMSLSGHEPGAIVRREGFPFNLGVVASERAISLMEPLSPESFCGSEMKRTSLEKWSEKDAKIRGRNSR